MSEQTYTVFWSIDIDAEDSVEAARKALRIQRNPDSIATVFDVADEADNHVRVDLTELDGDGCEDAVNQAGISRRESELSDLQQFEVRWPDDDAALNPRLVHVLCGNAVTDVEEGDTLSVLNATAREHAAYGCPGAGEDAVNHDTYREQTGEDA
jgi:hypothetical protein